MPRKPAKAKPSAKPKSRRVTVALLDDTGLLTGYDIRTVPAELIGAPGCVRVPEGCDLAPGKYRWNAVAGRFDPLPPNEPGQGPPPPDATRAIWAGLRAMQQQGMEFPAETRAWIKAYGETLDAKG